MLNLNTPSNESSPPSEASPHVAWLRDCPYYMEALERRWMSEDPREKCIEDDAQRLATCITRLNDSGQLNETIQGELDEMLRHGSINGFEIPLGSPSDHHLADFRQIDRLGTLIILFGKNPELVKTMLETETRGVHGTTSASLVGALKHGLRPAKKRRESRSFTMAGEKAIGGAASEELVSFFNFDEVWDSRLYTKLAAGLITEKRLKKRAEELKTAIARLKNNDGELRKDFRQGLLLSAEMNLWDVEATLEFLEKPDKDELETLQEEMIRENFPILLFIKHPENGTTTIQTDLSDTFEARGGVASREITILAVPREKISHVQQVADKLECPVEVFAIEDYSF